MTEKWHKGSSLDAFLDEEGVREAFAAIVEKEAIAWQFAEAMKARHLSKKRMAELMKTSRTQVDKLLNPQDGNVTLETLHKAASVLGKRFEFKLI